MTALEKNIRFMWQKRDINQEAWLCLFDFTGQNIHIRFVKNATNGEFSAQSLAPRFEFRSYDLRKLLRFVFVSLSKEIGLSATHSATVNRTLRFLDSLELNPTLAFLD
jgi:hypothetical protein